MSVITTSITNADREARYLNITELNAIQDYYATGNHRLQLASTLIENEREIIEKASLKFWEICPDTPSNSGNPVRRASCLRDQSWYIRLISYAVVVGDIEPLQEIGTVGVQEMYNSLEIPLANLVKAMTCLKDAALELFTLNDSLEVAPYFDYLIQNLIP